MKTLQVIVNKHFIGRVAERKQLIEIGEFDAAAIIIMYGRRRVGKTELIEQTYAKRNIIKIEGVEGKDEAEQRRHVLLQISKFTQDSTYAKLQLDSWTEVFELLAK